jgi:hypothetical protein
LKPFWCCAATSGPDRPHRHDLMNAALEAIGICRPDESQTTAMLRDQLFVHGALIGNPHPQIPDRSV